MRSPKSVAILAYDQLCTFEYGIAVEIFATARPEIRNWYTCKTIAATNGPLRMAGGLKVQCDSNVENLGQFDLIIVPGWPVDSSPTLELATALWRAHDRGAKFMTICSGIFLLIQLQMTKGKTITTHWRYIDRLKADAPNAHIEENVLYCCDGQILSSAGSAAGIDLGLEIVRQDFGTATANAIAQRLVLAAHRQGGQKQFVPRPLHVPHKNGLAELLDNVRQHLSQDWTLKSLAESARMSERTLIRRFQDSMGQSPANWLVQERLYAARDMLEQDKLSIDEIADKVGFKTAETLRHHFRKKMKVSPVAYRKNFAAQQTS